MTYVEELLMAATEGKCPGCGTQVVVEYQGPEVDEWELLLDLETEAEKLAIEVETFPRSIRGLNYLRRLGITTVRDLLARPKSEVREMFSDQPGVVAQFEEIWRRASRGAVSIGGDKAPPSRSVPLDSADLPTDTGT